MATLSSTSERSGISDTTAVDKYMAKLKHPLKDVTEELRQIILSADKNLGEEIAWNAPAFFYTGKMKPFDPKEYKRSVVVFNLSKKDCVRLIFLKGALVKSKIFEGDFKDQRRMIVFRDPTEVITHKKELQNIVKTLVGHIKKA